MGSGQHEGNDKKKKQNKKNTLKRLAGKMMSSLGHELNIFSRGWRRLWWLEQGLLAMASRLFPAAGGRVR